MIIQNVLCHLPEEKAHLLQPSQPLFSKGAIRTVLAPWTSAGKEGQHAPESRLLPCQGPALPLPAHGPGRQAMLLATGAWEGDATRCSSCSGSA